MEIKLYLLLRRLSIWLSPLDCGHINCACIKTLQEEETLLNCAQQRVNTSEGEGEKSRMAGLCPFAKWLLFLKYMEDR